VSERGIYEKPPACGQLLKRREGVCRKYTCINLECLENKKAHLQAYAEFYGLTYEEVYANYRKALAKNRRKKGANHKIEVK
jgi:hypothetical protein